MDLLAGSGLALATKLTLVRRFGGVGVAIGATIGFIAQNLAMLFVVKRDLGVWTSVLSIRQSVPAVRLFLTMLRLRQES